jgi:hypothetical protein
MFSSRLLSALAIAMFSAQAAMAAAPTPGSELRGLLRTAIDSKTAYVGEPVLMYDVANRSGSIQGATMRGYVSSVVHAGQGRPGKVQLRFTSLTLRDGTRYGVVGEATGVSAQTKNNALKEAGGAIAGMLVGNAIFKTLFLSSAGGLVGAAGGYLLAKNNRQDVTIPANSVVVVSISSTRRQA